MKIKKTFPVVGMSCASCAARIDKVIHEQPGVYEANINYATAQNLALRLFQQAHAGQEYGAVAVELLHMGARKALHQQFDLPVVHLDHAQNHDHGTHGIQIFRAGFVGGAFALGAEQKIPVSVQGEFHGVHGLFTAFKQRHDHGIEHHAVAQGQYGQYGGNGGSLVVGLAGGVSVPLFSAAVMPVVAGLRGGIFLLLFQHIVLVVFRHCGKRLLRIAHAILVRAVPVPIFSALRSGGPASCCRTPRK